MKFVQNFLKTFSLKKLRKRSKIFYRKLILEIRHSWLVKIILKLPIVKKNFHIKQFIKFILVGVISTLIDFSIYVFLTRLFVFWQVHYLWANFIAMIIASIVNFLLNRKWTFRNGRKKILHQYIDFCIVLIGGLFLYQFLFGFFVTALNWYDIIAKVVVAFVIMLIRFCLHKFWVFK